MIDVTFSSALENATREKVVLTLGLDPTISGKAFEASRLYLAWAEAGKRLEEFKNEFRTYVSEKRDFWNEANEDKVTTLKIPFRLKTERGVEVRFISVSCTATYTVDKILSINSKWNAQLNTKSFSLRRPRRWFVMAERISFVGI